MSLEEYKKKRDFRKTTEPGGEVEEAQDKKIFVIQKHDATNLHYDFRLEMEGVLKSWAVPKKPPQKPNVKRLAIQTEDHPLEYANFQGIIPRGQYGAGKVEIWDKGTYTLEEKEEKKLLFKLKGDRLKGKYALIKLKPRGKYKGENNWLLFKKKE